MTSDPPPDRKLLQVADANLPDSWLALYAAPPRRNHIMQLTVFDGGWPDGNRHTTSASLLLTGPAARALLTAIQEGLDWYPEAAPSKRERVLQAALLHACHDIVRMSGLPGDQPGDIAESYILQAEDADQAKEETAP